MNPIVLAATLFIVQIYASCSNGDATASKYYSNVQSGTATYYGLYGGGGACTLDPTPFAGSNGVTTTVAISADVWDSSYACGMCIQVTATGSGSGSNPVKGTFIAYVNNLCPECNPTSIDIGQSGDGAWGVTWKAVPCPVGTENIQFLLQGDNQYYIKLQARNTRYPVEGISILQSGVYHDLQRTADNFFTAGSSVVFPLTYPITVKVTATTGDFVIDTVPSLTNGVVMDGTQQFPDCSSGSTGAASTATTTTTTTTATATTAKSTTTTTTAKPTTITTGSSATTTAKSATTSTSTTGSQSSTAVYSDSLIAPFQEWSWATTTPCVSNPVYAGSCSYGFVPASWQAAYFSNSNGFSSTTNSAIEFQIYPTSANTKLTFAVVQGGLPATPQIPINAPGGSWTKISIPLSSFPAGTYQGMWWQDASGVTQAQVYLDDVKIIGK